MQSLTLDRGRSHAPREPLADLVARVDLAALVEQYAGPGKRSGASVLYQCPNPAHPDRHPSFEVNTRTGRARCYSQCGFSGDALDLVKWLEGLDTGQAAARLRAHLGEWESPAPITRKAKPEPVTTQRRTPLTDTNADAVPEEVKTSTLARYCTFRGWPLSVVETFGLDVVRDTHGALRVRHHFYAPTAAGEWVSVWAQDRGPASSPVRWLSTKGAAALPYNLRALETDNLSAVVITEGPSDCITAALALEGVEGVAVIGVPGSNSWREEWAALVEGVSVVICRDNDTAGEHFAEKVLRTLSKPASIITPPANDLCETLDTHGLDVVRRLLLAGLEAAGHSPGNLREESDTDRAARLIFAAFPGAEFVEEVPA